MKTRIPALAGLMMLVCLSSSPLRAAELDGVKLPDTASVDGKTLNLNGMGTRKATLFKVKVYVGGLYLEAASSDPQAILASPQLKRVQMQFVRDVGAKDIQKTWRENFERNCADQCEALKPKLDQLLSFLGADIKSGDTTTYTFTAEKVEVMIGSEKKGQIEGASMAKLMLSAYIGPKVIDENLRDGLLGLKK